MSGEPIFVAGLGRCGSSLVMQMLAAAGVPCLGQFPAFEPEEVNEAHRDPIALLGMASRAMKILDPHRDGDSWPNPFIAKVIWLDREFRQQAKSQVKFLREVSGIDADSRAWRRIEKSLIRERLVCGLWLARCEPEPLVLSFEEILSDPDSCASRICSFLGVIKDNAICMAESVIRRNSRCRSDMSLEMALIQAQEVAARYGVSVNVAVAAERILDLQEPGPASSTSSTRSNKKAKSAD
jgi:hypothetical protein